MAKVSFATDGYHFGRARKSSPSLLRFEVSNSRAVLGRGVEQISDGIKRLGAMCGKRMLLRRGAKSLGPSSAGDDAAASGGDRRRSCKSRLRCYSVGGQRSRMDGTGGCSIG